MGIIADLGGSAAAKITSTEEYQDALQRSFLTPLAHASPGDQANIIGVVTHCTEPKETRTHDYSVCINLVDPSLPLAGFLPCIAFRASLNQCRNLVCVPGDIVVFDRVKIQVFEKAHQAVGFKDKEADIVRVGMSVAKMHPVVRYLREWWQQRPVSEILIPAKMPLEHMEGMRTEKQRPEVTSGSRPQAPKPMSGSKNLQQVHQLVPGNFSDIIVEILHVTHHDRSWHCLVTDYSENPLVHETKTPTTPVVGGKRLVPLIINNPQYIPGLPSELLLNAFYKFRRCHVRETDMDGLQLMMMPDAMYPDKILVRMVKEDSEDLRPLLRRRAKCLRQVKPRKMSTRQTDLGAGTNTACCTGAGSVTEHRFVLELTDASASVLAVCQGSYAERLLARVPASPGDGSLRSLWPAGQPFDFGVASVLLPGPGPAHGSLVRTLVVVDM
ncbi:hypothetical protein DL89DRAFT_295971 [Linderina pennispora]|uniref:Telomeric single stranded DNA binding POT1/Cdc13 domain-containing protein n=1 Tax=Linderina pennispora TaxID=61395 RepID=A0A1Y1VWS3_9FUNG|nr:uncharacterized protein DL89DRAFT_295971 [Linderina pennispora]ORX65730.1 hypothetical protein DL89DRAFT_295971 [Linderina pennispora]